MKKILFALYTAAIFAACQNTSAPAPTPAQAAPTPAPAKQKKMIAKMPEKEILDKLGLSEKEKSDLTYTGYYEYTQNAQNQEVMQGRFEIVSDGDKDKLTEEDYFSFVKINLSGNFENGQKQGDFLYKTESMMGEANCKIVFDKNQCGEAIVDAAYEGMCMEYKGKLKTCTFAELQDLAKEVDCK